MVQRIVQGVQNLLHGIPDGKELSPVGGRNVQVHVALGHLGQLFINILDVRFQLPLGLVDGVHQHTQLRGVRLPPELRREVALGDLSHLVLHGDHRLKDTAANHTHTEHLKDANHHQGQNHQHPDDQNPALQRLDLPKRTGVQVLQKLLLQTGDLRQSVVVVVAVHVVDRKVSLPCLDLLHGLLLQGDQLIGQSGHLVNHALLLVGDADFLHGNHALVPVFQSVDLVPVIVIMLLHAGRRKSPDLVGQVRGAVHETVGVVGQLIPLLIGLVQTAAGAGVDNQQYQQ